MANFTTLIITLGCLLFSLLGVSQNTHQHRYCKDAIAILETIQQHHYSPRPVDKKFSEDVLSNFILRIDPYQLYLTEKERIAIQKDTFDLMSQIEEGDCLFLQKTTESFKTGLLNAGQIIDESSSSHIDFGESDTIKFSRFTRLVQGKSLRDSWRKLIKYKILYRYHLTSESEVSPSLQTLDSLKLEVLTNLKCINGELLSSDSALHAFIGENFLQSIATSFDPHTNFLSTPSYSYFEEMLSTEVSSFGLELEKNRNGDIEVSKVIPGGAAWNSSQVQKGDVILSVTTQLEEKKFNCIKVDEALEFLASNDIKDAKFNLAKEGGKVTQVELTKSTIDQEENALQSFILEMEEKIGYVYIPAFYTDYDESKASPQGSGHDLSRELIKLTQQGITGLIIDLRDNGGGSVMEALSMSGIFIDHGPIGMMNIRESPKPMTLYDRNRGAIYDGPLLILVNEYSASASEFFASTMQDYNRAIIVGNSTFGKFSGQNIFPLNENEAEEQGESLEQLKSAAHVKVTIGAFHRLDGKSSQGKGVQPDIVLQRSWNYPKMTESMLPNSLEFDAVSKKTYPALLAPLPIDTLRSLHLLRTNANPTSTQPNIILSDTLSLALNYSEFLDFIKLYATENEEKFKAEYEVSVATYDGLPTETVAEEVLEGILSDKEIAASASILSDLILLMKNN